MQSVYQCLIGCTRPACNAAVQKAVYPEAVPVVATSVPFVCKLMGHGREFAAIGCERSSGGLSRAGGNNVSTFFREASGKLVSPLASRKNVDTFCHRLYYFTKYLSCLRQLEPLSSQGCLVTFTIMDINRLVSLLKRRNDWHYFFTWDISTAHSLSLDSPK